MITVFAIVPFGSFGRTSRIDDDIPSTVAMTSCTHIRVNVEIFTVTGMCCIAFLNTSRRRYYGGVYMTVCVNVSIYVRIATNRASVRSIAPFSTRGWGYNGSVAMTGCIHISIYVQIISISAGVCGIALFVQVGSETTAE
jgi:hypothetical protein